MRAFLAGDPVALYVFQWSGPSSQVPMLPGWVMVDSEADLTSAAAVITASERVSSRHYTALGDALVHASDAFAEGPPCRARTVDVSSDGLNNKGPEPQAVYGIHFLDGVTVNALLVTLPTPDENTPWMGKSAQLKGWFQSAVLHGPGAFLVEARGFEVYERAMTEKLRREVEPPLMSGWPRSPEAG